MDTFTESRIDSTLGAAPAKVQIPDTKEVAELRRKIRDIIDAGRFERETPELRKIAA